MTKNEYKAEVSKLFDLANQLHQSTYALMSQVEQSGDRKTVSSREWFVLSSAMAAAGIAFDLIYGEMEPRKSSFADES